MIVEQLLNIIAYILDTVFGFIPSVESAPDWWIENIQPTMGIFSGLNSLPVVGTMFEIGILMLTFLGGWQGVIFVNWIYNKIRGSG